MKRAVPTVLWLVGLGVQFAVWVTLAPQLDCFWVQSRCVYQVERISSPYFLADAAFGLGGIVAGLLFSFAVSRRAREYAFRQMLAIALFGLLGSFLVSRFGSLLQPARHTSGDYGVDALELRALGFVFVWPLTVQLRLLLARRFRRKSG